MYIALNDIDNAVVRLESIINEYERTKISAEAYFLLGKIYLSDIWKPDLAKEKFLLVKKEFSRSEYGPISETKIKAIDGYNYSKENLNLYHVIKADSVLKDTVVSDTIKNDISLPSESYEELLYHIGDIEAFSFERLDSGIVFFKKILENDPDSKFYPKALFTLSLIYSDIDDSVNSEKYKNMLMAQFPSSDYTSYLFKNDNVNKEKRPIELLFSKAETLWASNPQLSMDAFKKVIKADSLSEISASAAYFLGYQYDHTFTKVDSAFKYYDWVSKRHPMSEQSIQAKSRSKILKQSVVTTKNDTITTVN